MDMSTLRIIEIFASVQGESSLTGLPTTFVRLAACNLRCRWCDTTYSFGRGEAVAVEQIIETVQKNGCQCVCITGGEPLLQQEVYPLMQTLCNLGYTVSLETSGSLPTNQVDERVRVILDIKCPGSKMSKKNHWPNLAQLRSHDEVKFVIADREDYLYSVDVCRRYQLFDKKCELLFSPVFGELEPKQLVKWILEDRLPIRLNLQIHKFIWSPETKGV